MATIVRTPDRFPQPPARQGLAALIDRWIFVFMAGLFVVVTLAGFVPSSIVKIAAVEAGQRPPFPLILHIHAVLMGSWLILLLGQTSLMAMPATPRAEARPECPLGSYAVRPLPGSAFLPSMSETDGEPILPTFVGQW
jgi:hypothetical protein